ncbi:MAG: protein kinase [Acidobacteria bacterium]|nr:protein kinase [Acidobacteriota bacterium]
MSDLDHARRVHALMLDALALPEAQRLAFLREQCGDDALLIAQVQELLSGADEAEQFFDRLGGDVDQVISRTSERAEETGRTADGVPADDEEPDLSIGEKVGHFEITGELGRGGMGTVYRATDQRLGREVALKVLPRAVTAGSEIAERFEQEARLLARLSHTNIASIFGIEDHAGLRILVLELIDGPGLEERIRQGRLRISEGLETAMQIARALEVAHRAGIVHRDLKPSNVKLVGSTGLVKVLDFGIATMLPDAELSSADSHRDIVSTGVGRVLGTVAYMSPEQARGDEVDERADIWAWGCVLFEMLCGQRPFQGRTVTDTLAAIIERDPDWNLLPPATPPEVTQMLRRCLRKDPRRRLRNAGDLWLVLEELLHPATDDELRIRETIAPPATWRRALPWAIGAAALAIGLLIGRGFSVAPDQEPTRRLELQIDGEQLRTAAGGRVVAVSPDGSTVAHTADGMLHLRPLDSFEDRQLEGTFGAESPTYSPDGEWIAFFARGQLRKVSVRGGDPFPLCDAALPRGAHWGTDDRIVFSDGTAIYTVPANGGECEVVYGPDPDGEPRRHVWPTWLPGQDKVLYQLTGSRMSQIHVLDLETGASRMLQPSGSDPRYVSTGHLLFTKLGTLFAIAYDLDSGEIGNTPTPVLDDVSAESTGATHMAISDTGVAAYAPSPDNSRELVWVNRDGSESLAAELAGDYTTPRASPDGRRIAMVIRRAGERQVWILDVESQTLSQLPGAHGSIWPAWAPDGERVSFSSGAEGPATVWWQPVSGAAATRISTEGQHQYASSWAANAEVVTWFQPGQNGSRDIWAQRTNSESGSFPVVSTEAHEQGPALSPDARWLVYSANTSGANEVYLEACRPCVEDGQEPGPEGRWQLSTGGGSEAIWSPRGDEVFFRQGSNVMSVQVDLSGRTPRTAAPVQLFDGPYVLGQSGNRNYDVAPTGDTFLMVKNPEESGGFRIRVVLNWFNELRQP